MAHTVVFPLLCFGTMTIHAYLSVQMLSLKQDNSEMKTRLLFDKMENEHRAEMLMREQKHKTDIHAISQHIRELEKRIGIANHN